MQITEDNPGSQVSVSDKLSSAFSTTDMVEKFQQTQYKILQSRSLAQRVIKALKLSEYPEFNLREKNPEMKDDEFESKMTDIFLGNLQVMPVKNSYLVELYYQSTDKALAQKVVNAIADEYMYLAIDRRTESFKLVRKWLDRQLQQMADKVQEAQKKLYKFGQKTDIYTMEEKDNVVIQKFIDLSGLLTKAQADKMAREAQYQQIKAKGPNAPLIVNHPLVAALRQQVVTQQAKVSALSKVFLRGHPDIQAEKANLAELQARLKSEIQRLRESVKADYEAAYRTEKLLKEGLADQKGLMAKLQDHLSEFQILKRDAQTNEQLYQALLARVKEANISSTMVPSNVTTIDQAELPEKPFKPKKQKELALAAILGLTLGLILAFLVEQLDDSIKSVEDLEKGCNFPSLGIVPLISGNDAASYGLKKKINAGAAWRYLPWVKHHDQSLTDATNLDLMVYKQPSSQVTEAIRHTHTSIMLSASGRPPSVIMVTSPNPSEGKTMIASNLAVTLAMDGLQSVIIDCDLRKPRVHRIFEMESQPGLTNYLSGNATLEEIIRPTYIPDLMVITAGARPPSPGNLLSSEIFKELLTKLREQFRHIIIDTPPLLGFADGRIISVMADGVMVVVKHNYTQKSAGRLTYQLLSQIHAPIIGGVLNCVGKHGHAYGGYYFYNKYYSKYF